MQTTTRERACNTCTNDLPRSLYYLSINGSLYLPSSCNAPVSPSSRHRIPSLGRALLQFPVLVHLPPLTVIWLTLDEGGLAQRTSTKSLEISWPRDKTMETISVDFHPRSWWTVWLAFSRSFRARDPLHFWRSEDGWRFIEGWLLRFMQEAWLTSKDTKKSIQLSEKFYTNHLSRWFSLKNSTTSWLHCHFVITIPLSKGLTHEPF